MKLLGIKTCDTCRKAWHWLDGQGIAYQWIDLREDGVDRETLAGWVRALGVESLVNKRSTTWRGLTDGQRAALAGDAAVDLLATQPTLVKRPVFVKDGEVRVGFDDEVRDWLA